MKVTQTDMVWKALPQSTIRPSFMTAVLKLREKMSIFEFSKVFHCVLWPWLWLKDPNTGRVWKILPQSTILSSFMTVVLVVSEKMSMFQFSKIFYSALWPWLWMKATQTGMVRKALPQSTIVPSFMTVTLSDFNIPDGSCFYKNPSPVNKTP